MALLVTALVAFAFGFIGSMPLTGPVAVMVFSECLRGRHGVALRVGLGAALAEACYAAVAFWGFTHFFSEHPAVLPVSKGLSALLLVGLGVYFARWSPGGDSVLEPEGRAAGFLVGFSVSALNPTLLATWSGAVAFLHARQLVHFTRLGALPFGLGAGAGVACWEAVFVGLSWRLGQRFSLRAMTWGVRGMGLLLLGGAVFSGMDFVRSFQR
ncbi:LysE family transporter [Cystobacter fuscus]|uniref:LysE family transporter n=1 Tax=Cystobacter fuscus TaxID=43 RepID=UPI0037BE37DD